MVIFVPVLFVHRLYVELCGFLHDGAPAHYHREVRMWLDNNFVEKWIGRNGPVLWPPRSPDLNVCDYLWGHMKQSVYSTPVHTQQELRERVKQILETIRNSPDIRRAQCFVGPKHAWIIMD
jgi:hypothetical protein